MLKTLSKTQTIKTHPKTISTTKTTPLFFKKNHHVLHQSIILNSLIKNKFNNNNNNKTRHFNEFPHKNKHIVEQYNQLQNDLNFNINNQTNQKSSIQHINLFLKSQNIYFNNFNQQIHIIKNISQLAHHLNHTVLIHPLTTDHNNHPINKKNIHKLHSSQFSTSIITTYISSNKNTLSPLIFTQSNITSIKSNQT